jgi:hypothetical protein
VVIGNSGGGKSTLARRFARARALPLIEVAALLWRPGWQLASDRDYDAAHARALAAEAWIMEGLGRLASIPARLDRAMEVVLIDMPLEVHLHLATKRHEGWETGLLPHPPGGIHEAPPLAALLGTIREVDRTWLPELPRWVDAAEAGGAAVMRILSLSQLAAYAAQLGPEAD